MKKLKFAAIASPLVLVAPIALASCGTDNGNPNPEVGMTDQQARDAYRATVAKNGDLGRYKAFQNANGTATDAINYYDVLSRIYNDDKTDGIIENLTIAENYYNDGALGEGSGGSIKPWFDAKLFPTIIDTNVDSEIAGIKQNLVFDENVDWTTADGFKEAHAFKTWKLNKADFERNYTIASSVHNEIKQIVDNDKSNKYILYVPQVASNDEYSIFLFKKKVTSKKIIDAWNYFKNNFEVSMDSLSKLHSTYLLQPTQRFVAIEKEKLTWDDVDANGNPTETSTFTSSYDISNKNKANEAALHGDFLQKSVGEIGLDRSSGSNLHGNYAIKFKGTESDWTNVAMKTLAGVSFNISWVRDEKTYEEKLKVTVMENGNQEWTANGEKTLAVTNMETFIFDGKDVMRFADVITTPLQIWKSPTETLAVKNTFSYSDDKLFALVNSNTFSYNGLTDVLYGLQSYSGMFKMINAFEAKTEIADLYAVLAKTNANNYNLQNRSTFDKFVLWVKNNYPNFGFKTLQFIFEQLDGIPFPSVPTPLTHYELALTSQLYGMMIKFFEDPVNASLRPQFIDVDKLKASITDENAKTIVKKSFADTFEFNNYVDSLTDPRDFAELMAIINKSIAHDASNADFALDQNDKDKIKGLITVDDDLKKIVFNFSKKELLDYIDANAADSQKLSELQTQLQNGTH